MITATIFQKDVLTASNTMYDWKSLTKAVSEFNRSGQMVVFENYPDSSGNTDLGRVAGSARLYVRDDYVEAEISILDTPYGRIVQQLYDSGIELALMPTVWASVKNNNLATDISIIKLTFINVKSMPQLTPLRIVQNWVGQGTNDMFKLIEGDK